MNMKTLKLALKACDGNQSKLADRIGTSRQVVNKWLVTKRVPSWRVQALLNVVKSNGSHAD